MTESEPQVRRVDSDGLVIEKRVGNSDSGGLVTTSGCLVIKTVRGFGPYAYRVTKHKGKQTWKYLGRADGLVTEERVGNSDSQEVPS